MFETQRTSRLRAARCEGTRVRVRTTPPHHHPSPLTAATIIDRRRLLLRMGRRRRGGLLLPLALLLPGCLIVGALSGPRVGGVVRRGHGFTGGPGGGTEYRRRYRQTTPLRAARDEPRHTPQPDGPDGPGALSTRRAWCTGVVGVALAAATPSAGALPSIFEGADDLPGLTWVPRPNGAPRPSTVFKEIESSYGLRFVEYLSRLLLNYDPASKVCGMLRGAAARCAALCHARARL